MSCWANTRQTRQRHENKLSCKFDRDDLESCFHRLYTKIFMPAHPALSWFPGSFLFMSMTHMITSEKQMRYDCIEIAGICWARDDSESFWKRDGMSWVLIERERERERESWEISRLARRRLLRKSKQASPPPQCLSPIYRCHSSHNLAALSIHVDSN